MLANEPDARGANAFEGLSDEAVRRAAGLIDKSSGVRSPPTFPTPITSRPIPSLCIEFVRPSIVTGLVMPVHDMSRCVTALIGAVPSEN